MGQQMIKLEDPTTLTAKFVLLVLLGFVVLFALCFTYPSGGLRVWSVMLKPSLLLLNSGF
jgi:hypothetical protein